MFLFGVQSEGSIQDDTNCMLINAYNAAGISRRQVKNVTNFVKNVRIVEIHDHIWSHHKKYIQISTNMTVIGSLIREKGVNISEI